MTTFANRTCAAKLIWEKHEFPVVTGAWQLDLDAFGVDFGDGVPSAAFEIKKSESGCCSEYSIYQLGKPPRLVRTIAGGDFYSASDVDLDGRIEIWTNDAATVDGFEGLVLGELDAPSIVFRFERGKLLDVSSEFRSYFDDEIFRRRNEIQADDLQAFKNSDGKLATSPTPASADRLHRLRAVKAKVLEIVWAYLYSGREQDAWNSLAELWPSVDSNRIRSAILQAYSIGIHRLAEGASTAPPEQPKKKVRIFTMDRKSLANPKSPVTPPQGILLELPPEFQVPQSTPVVSQLNLNLVIDAAGKVRSADPVPFTTPPTSAQIVLAESWRFVPALHYGKPVASRLRITVSPKQ